MLQTNPAKRPSTDEFLNNEIIQRKTNSKGSFNHVNEPKQSPLTLLGTIKLPRNMNEINSRLPKKKQYKQEK